MVVATSPAQSEAWIARTLPGPELVRDDILSIPVPAPHGSYIPYTLCYAAADGPVVHLVDPGSGLEPSSQIISHALRVWDRGLDDVTTVVATHVHPDHLAMAVRLREDHGVLVALGRREQEALRRPQETVADIEAAATRWGVPDDERSSLGSPRPLADGLAGFEADVLLDDGDPLPIPSHRIVAIHTPGHTSGHLSFYAPSAGALFTGDHVLPGVVPGVGRGGPHDGNPLTEYLGSLERIRSLAAEVLPGHGYRFSGLTERCDEIAAHHRRRTAEVAAVQGADPDASVWDIARRVTWTAGWETLQGVLRRSALAQVEMHLALAGSRK